MPMQSPARGKKPSLLRSVYSSYRNFFPALYYFIIGILLLVKFLFPQLDSCGGSINFFCFGPVTSSLIILTLPSVIILAASGLFDAMDKVIGPFGLVILFSVWLLVTVPVALVLAGLGNLLDSGKIRPLVTIVGSVAGLVILFLILASYK